MFHFFVFFIVWMISEHVLMCEISCDRAGSSAKTHCNSARHLYSGDANACRWKQSYTCDGSDSTCGGAFDEPTPSTGDRRLICCDVECIGDSVSQCMYTFTEKINYN